VRRGGGGAAEKGTRGQLQMKGSGREAEMQRQASLARGERGGGGEGGRGKTQRWDEKRREIVRSAGMPLCWHRTSLAPRLTPTRYLADVQGGRICAKLRSRFTLATNYGLLQATLVDGRSAVWGDVVPTNGCNLQSLGTGCQSAMSTPPLQQVALLVSKRTRTTHSQVGMSAWAASLLRRSLILLSFRVAHLLYDL